MSKLGIMMGEMLPLSLSTSLSPAFAWPNLAHTEFWQKLYDSGDLGLGGDERLIALVLVRVVAAGLLLVAGRVLVGLLRRLVRRALFAVGTHVPGGQDQRRLTTLYGLLTSALSYSVYTVVAILVLFTLGASWKSLAPLLGAASVLGLAIGFGAQRLVRDLISGLFILGEGQFDAGDWVTIGGVTGRVEEMGLRVTRLRDDQGRMYVIANGDITQVFNASRGKVKLAIEIALQRSAALDEQLQTIRQAALETLAACDVVIDDEQLTLALIGMDAAKVTLRLKLWVPVASLESIEDRLRRRLLKEQEMETVVLA